jgi:signal transduction histidine kinase
MKTTNNKSDSLSLRQKAEELLKSKPAKSVSQLSEAETHKLIHELEVHQFELELQNKELMLAKSAAQDAAKKYIDLYDFAPSGYVTLSAGSEIKKLNFASARLLGKERSRLINSDFRLFVTEDTRLVFIDFLRKSFTSKAKEICEVALENNGNSPLFVHVEGIVNEEKQCFVNLVDISDRKLAEKEIVRLNAELENRVKQRTLQLENTNNEIEAFSYSVSHDLRSPLRGIDGWSLALLEDYNKQLDEKGQVYLSRVRNEAQRMGSLIDDLLKLSHVTRVEMRQEEVDLTGLAKTIVKQLTGMTPKRQFKFSVAPGLFVQGDHSLLEIALTNLLDNACKFTGQQTVAQIELGKLEVDGKQTIFIRDNGVGFEMKNAKNLFGAFKRMHKQSDYPGTGIGLAIVKRIITRHGGRIWAESQPGEGAIFYFTISMNT